MLAAIPTCRGSPTATSAAPAISEPGASFVLSDPRKAQDYAWRAVHLTAVTAKAIAADYFGRKVAHAYWNSCSNGGRQGLIEAQRFPADFDGIVANAPWVSQTGFTMGAVWNQQVLSRVPLTQGKLQTLAARVMARCDGIDGLSDGLIKDLRMTVGGPAVLDRIYRAAIGAVGGAERD
jgi:feruloyl esterase